MEIVFVVILFCISILCGATAVVSLPLTLRTMYEAARGDERWTRVATTFATGIVYAFVAYVAVLGLSLYVV